MMSLEEKIALAEHADSDIVQQIVSACGVAAGGQTTTASRTIQQSCKWHGHSIVRDGAKNGMEFTEPMTQEVNAYFRAQLSARRSRTWASIRDQQLELAAHMSGQREPGI